MKARTRSLQYDDVKLSGNFTWTTRIQPWSCFKLPCIGIGKYLQQKIVRTRASIGKMFSLCDGSQLLHLQSLLIKHVPCLKTEYCRDKRSM